MRVGTMVSTVSVVGLVGEVPRMFPAAVLYCSTMDSGWACWVTRKNAWEVPAGSVSGLSDCVGRSLR